MNRPLENGEPKLEIDHCFPQSRFARSNGANTAGGQPDHDTWLLIRYDMAPLAASARPARGRSLADLSPPIIGHNKTLSARRYENPCSDAARFSIKNDERHISLADVEVAIFASP